MYSKPQLGGAEACAMSSVLTYLYTSRDAFDLTAKRHPSMMEAWLSSSEKMTASGPCDRPDTTAKLAAKPEENSRQSCVPLSWARDASRS